MSSAEKTPNAAPDLSPLAEKIALCVASGLTNVDTAAACRCNEKTVRRHREKPEIQQRIAALQSEAVARAQAMLANALPDAAAAIIADLTDKDKRRRLAAVKLLVSMYVKLRGADVLDKLHNIDDHVAAEIAKSE